MRKPSERSGSKPGRSRTWALAAGALVGATTVLYVWLIANQSPRDLARVAVVVALFVLALAATIGAVVLGTPELRHLAAAGGVGLLLSMGWLAIFSVGLFLLVAAGLLIAAIGAERDGGRRTPGILVFAALVAGAGMPWVLVVTA